MADAKEALKVSDALVLEGTQGELPPEQPSTAVPYADTPTLVLDPAEGTNGSSVAVWAEGFDPTGWVSLFAGVRWLLNTGVSSHGTFRAMVALEKGKAGKLTVVAQAYTPQESRDAATHIVERDLDDEPLASAVFQVTE